MDLRLGDLMTLARDTVLTPREGVARLLGLNLPLEARWLAMGAVVSLSAVMAYLANILFPLPVETPWAPITSSPLRMVVTQAVGVLFVAGAMTHVGRVFGGRGSFADALLLAVWMEFVLLLVQLVQVVLMAIYPLTATFMGFFALILFFYMLTHFTAALHGFTSLIGVFVGVIGTLIGGALILTFVLGILGVTPPAGN